MTAKGESTDPEGREEAVEQRRPWSPSEVTLIVADYFDMLGAELAAEPYSKADHDRALRDRLDRRSRSSVKYKHQNISAVLIGMGLPHIDGYRPARNIQRALTQAVGEYLVRHPEFFDRLADGSVLSPAREPTIGDRPATDFFEGPPELIIVPPGDDRP